MVLVLARIVAALVAVVSVGAPAADAVASQDPPADSAPPTTLLDNPFLPDNTAVNLSECISALPRPECGSKERGGWRQAAVFGAVVVGLAAVGTRLVISLRRRSDTKLGDRDA